MPPSEPRPIPASPAIQALISQAREDLANRLKAGDDQIAFVDFEAMVWPDSSLGCPQPGMAYLQVMREGYRIRLSFEGRIYNYHGEGIRPPFLCENPAKDVPNPPPGLGND